MKNPGCTEKRDFPAEHMAGFCERTAFEISGISF